MTRRPRLDVAIAIAAIVGGFAYATPTPRPAPSHPAISAAAGQPASGKAGTLETASGTDGATARTGTSGSAGASGAPPLHSRQASHSGPGQNAPRAPWTGPGASQRPRVDSDATARAQTAPRASGKAQTDRVATAGHAITGTATWYATGGPGLYAATHDYVDGTRVQVAVCALPHHRTVCITVPVVTQCGACRWRPGAILVDLSNDAFLALGVPLSAGVVRITAELLS